MAARILRIELRRSAALGTALVIAAVGVFVLFASNPRYGSWMELVINQRQQLALTWPLALAAGAWQGIRERRSRVEELLSTTPRPRRRRVLPVATAMAIAVVVAQLVTFFGGAGHLRHPDAYFPAGAVPIIVIGAFGLVAAVWLGLAIGALLPSPLTPPMLAVIGFAGLALLVQVLFDSRARPGTYLLFPLIDSPREGAWHIQILSARANLSQALWLATLATAGLTLFAAGRAGTRMAAALPIVLGAAIAAPAMPRSMADAWIEDHRATEAVCTADEPRVCITRAHAYALDHVRGPARQALAVLAAKLPSAPTRVEVPVVRDGIPEGPQPADTILVYVQSYVDLTEYSPDNLLEMLLTGAGVRPCVKQLGLDPTKFQEGSQPEPNSRYEDARRAAYLWLIDRDPRPVAGRDGKDPAREALNALRALPVDEQRTRVAALRAAELTCAEGDRLELLTGTDEAR
jgi:hypothetical protein